MDVRRNPDPNVLGNVQTWQCIGGNTQQVGGLGFDRNSLLLFY
jgi:hypothetical protein